MNKKLKALGIITLFLHGSSAQALPPHWPLFIKRPLERFFTFFNQNCEQVKPYTAYIWPSIALAMTSAALYLVAKDYYHTQKKRIPRKKYPLEILDVLAQQGGATCGYEALLNALRSFQDKSLLIAPEERKAEIEGLKETITLIRKKQEVKRSLLEEFQRYADSTRKLNYSQHRALLENLANGLGSTALEDLGASEVEKETYPVNATIIKQILMSDSNYEKNADFMAGALQTFQFDITKAYVDNMAVPNEWLTGGEIEELLKQKDHNFRKHFTVIDNAESVEGEDGLGNTLDAFKSLKESWQEENNSLTHYFIIGTMEENKDSHGHWVMLKVSKENGQKKYSFADSLPSESHQECALTIINWLEN